eukprot:CAMPEP_0175701762 /NCGR_PEP_ID=MMETSP0097-20121207/35653_1 /TAXON_ID=311494 /ORGANISM="Alexandrium monilatum, Strain CCMP3105" /LENGTH=133 /DNA_ID=CAMNT_0017008999 /DNA_START=39 /DNA_END=438 /DNA_ORIENTATION=+
MPADARAPRVPPRAIRDGARSGAPSSRLASRLHESGGPAAAALALEAGLPSPSVVGRSSAAPIVDHRSTGASRRGGPFNARSVASMSSVLASSALACQAGKRACRHILAFMTLARRSMTLARRVGHHEPDTEE